MFYRPWQINRPDTEQAQALASACHLPRLVCDVLAARGKGAPQDAMALVGAGTGLSNPMLLANMDKAVARILRAVDEGERIAVFGDYDVDGVTATALLYLYLDSVGADVYYKLPNRDDDGYGLSESAVELIANRGVTLIITVDNGVCAHAPIALARQKGVDVVVTDHHLPPETLPDAVAVVDPQLPEDKSPCKNLSGAGVAFKLITALEGCSPDEMLPLYADLAAIGTVADVMLLEGENRTIVKAGLALLQDTDRPGLAALIEACGLAGKPITAENVSFGLSPRLNAAGRMDNATAALELLLCEDPKEADALVETLTAQNTARQKTEQEILQNILATITADPTYGADRILVVWGKGYHPGVIGIVASRVVEHFGKPAIIISIDENDEGKGSGRSVAGLSLYAAIASCADLLIRFGGHELAAGLSVRAQELPVLRARINAWAARNHPVMRRPPLVLDTPVRLEALGTAEVDALSLLAPFGNGNPAPLFYLENAVIDAVYAVSDGKHSRLRLRQGNAGLYAVLFGTGPEALCYKAGDAVDAAISLSVYEGKNGPMLSGRIKELRPAGLDNTYLESAQLYEALCCGAVLSKADKAQLRPLRADTVALYKKIVAGGVRVGDLRPLFACLGANSAGKTLVSLQALRELGLIAQKAAPDGACVWAAVPTKEKKDLASARVLRNLEGS